MSEDILDRLAQEREIKTIGRIGGGGGVVMMSHDIVQEAIAEITRLREERRWIPVEERLPDQYEIVMVGWAGRRDIGKGYLHHGKWHDPLVCMPDANQPTHWQPLPAPPSKGEVE